MIPIIHSLGNIHLIYWISLVFILNNKHNGNSNAMKIDFKENFTQTLRIHNIRYSIHIPYYFAPLNLFFKSLILPTQWMAISTICIPFYVIFWCTAFIERNDPFFLVVVGYWLILLYVDKPKSIIVIYYACLFGHRVLRLVIVNAVRK